MFHPWGYLCPQSLLHPLSSGVPTLHPSPSHFIMSSTTPVCGQQPLDFKSESVGFFFFYKNNNNNSELCGFARGFHKKVLVLISLWGLSQTRSRAPYPDSVITPKTPKMNSILEFNLPVICRWPQPLNQVVTHKQRRSAKMSSLPKSSSWYSEYTHNHRGAHSMMVLQAVDLLITICLPQALCFLSSGTV